MANNYRVGLVGCGRMGTTIDDEVRDRPDSDLFLPYSHAAAVVACERTELVAVCDRESDRIAEAVEASGCTGYRTLAPMLKDERVELVVVATPSKFHEPTALRALAAGKHVLVEKPAALKVAGIDKMIRAARRAGTVLTMHHISLRHDRTGCGLSDNPEFLQPCLRPHL